jgi:hypothetical protein
MEIGALGVLGQLVLYFVTPELKLEQEFASVLNMQETINKSQFYLSLVYFMVVLVFVLLQHYLRNTSKVPNMPEGFKHGT